jgi:protein-L-isoaspartate(D-aspartate) O-methyltransferase
METAEKYRRQLLEQSQHLYYDTPISEVTVSAYLATPRHLFVGRYREWGSREWHHVREANLQEHLAALYANRPLILSGEDDDDVPSTISQPSFVLRMLDLLRLKRGHKVFELGAGSGWSAALMGRVVGPEGHVYSLEIIPEVAKAAAETIERLGIRNVEIIAADGGEGYAAGAPYDRVIFAAGTYDLPRPFYEQTTDGALLLAVIKNEGGGDNLFLLRREADHFASLDSMPCGFVQLRGKYSIDSLEPITVEALPEWGELRHQEVSRVPFWWGGKGKDGVVWRTLGIRSFLSITEPSYRAFKVAKTDRRSREEHYFGLWIPAGRSLVLARDDQLIAYGTAAAVERMLHKVNQWVGLGMPTGASFALRIYPCHVAVTTSENEWLVTRRESKFLWSLGTERNPEQRCTGDRAGAADAGA